MRICITSLLLFISLCSNPQRKWTVEMSSGGVYNIPMPLLIEQKNEADIKISKAKFYSEPFVQPYYWDFRISSYVTTSSWEVEAIHHKLYLKNKPKEVKQFSISHGYNIFTINHAFIYKKIFFRLGIGGVFAHPETEIRNKKYEDIGNLLGAKYKLSGPVLNIGISKRIYLYKNLFFNSEIKHTFSYAKIPVADGYASFYNPAFHFILGLGIDITSRKEKK